jgi:hypothetical protein
VLGEVPPVEGQQREPALDAAGRDPGVVVRPGTTPPLRPGGELARDRCHLRAGRKDQRLVEQELQTAAAGTAPSLDPGTLPELTDGGEGDAEVEQVASRLEHLQAVLEPWGCGLPLLFLRLPEVLLPPSLDLGFRRHGIPPLRRIVAAVTIADDREPASVDNPGDLPRMTYPGSHQTWPRRAR